MRPTMPNQFRRAMRQHDFPRARAEALSSYLFGDDIPPGTFARMRERLTQPR